ncbi:hypothetical protein [Methylopila sp. M107]|uniref:MOSC domain-containing protein n=1 Tax=Methylopila sp. M107 TaxID=1101190 RepID=UPI000381A2ED|nr:hypothetical protein [Methylopila sp. M107]
MTRDLLDQIVIHPGRRLTAKLVATLITTDPDGFETTPVEAIDLTFEGLAGDRHAGFTRPAGAREPWYRNGAEIKSGRQLSIVSAEELWEIGYALGLPPIEPGWMGANLVLEGAPRLSFLPRGTQIFLPSGAVVLVEAQNAPCRHTGRLIARETGRPGDEITFPKIARRLRGLVASVEHPGEAKAGSDVSLRLPEQWIY